MLRMEITCFLVLFIIAVMYFSGQREKKLTHKTFSRLLIMMMIHLTFDAVTLYTANHIDTVKIWNNYAFHRIYGVTLVATLHFYYEYTRAFMMEETQYRIFQDWFLLLARIYLVVISIILLICPISFTITPKGNYMSGLAANVLYFSGFVYIVMIGCCLYRHWRGIHHKKRVVIAVTLVIEFFVVLAVLFRPTSFISGMGMTLMALAFYLTLDSPDIQLLQEVEEEKKKKEEAYAYKSKFLSAMSHEIRTPMNAVIGMTELMFRDKLTDKQRAYLEEIKNAGDTLVENFDKIVGESQDFENDEREHSQQFEQHSDETSFTAPEAKILVVDDNPTNRKVFIGLLARTQIQIDEADGGLSALEKVQFEKYDMIFLDYMMPDMDGIMVRKKMNMMGEYLNKNTPVIVLTANVVPGAREMYLEAGFDDFLTKPVHTEKLEQVIKEYLPQDKILAGEIIDSNEAQVENVAQMPGIDGVDWDYALLKLKEETLVREVVKDFSMLAENDLIELKGLYQRLFASRDISTEDFRQYRVKVHSMKTTAAMFGATNVSALARILEYAARDEDIHTIEVLQGIFAKQWLQLKEMTNEAFGFGNSVKGEKGKIEKNLLETYLDALEEAMKELDLDIADDTMEELQKYSYEDNMNQLIDQLAVAVRNLDTKASLKIIEACRMEGK